jgi:hypothetical protein
VESYQKVNIIIWSAILCSLVLLTIVVLILDKLQQVPASFGFPILSNLLFILAILLAVAILILKITFFRLDRILQGSSRLAETAEKVTHVLTELRRNYIILWVLADLIGTIGFVYYIYTGFLQNYLLFVLVSVFSLFGNFPNKSTVQACLNSLDSYGPTHE